MFKKHAFTLAEVLITLAIIGVVAVLTIGTFIPKIQEKIRERQITTAKIIFTRATEQMALNYEIGEYYANTAEFVDQLQNYLKVAKVCGNDELEECLGYEKIKTPKGKYISINDIKSGDDLGVNVDDSVDFKETIGIVTIRGDVMILSWNKKCPALEPGVYKWSGDTNITTSCVAAVIDVSQGKGQNALNKDVVLFGANKLGDECGIEFTHHGTKYCWTTPQPANVILDKSDCEANMSSYGINSCNVEFDEDYWGSAAKACAQMGLALPSPTELLAFAEYLYNDDYISSSADGISTGLNMDKNKLSNVSPELSASLKSNSWFFLWSNLEAGEDAYSRQYSNTSSIYTDSPRFMPDAHYVCVIE